ncbi:hypothetical protein K1T71_002234 [Dendrolimus kikuchii]|uniref:Uncharacterized protein n=1 Tax=Dendrolimus kikuchii TaxID=765133 RepID=A0ACC1DG32_9NEOP|nr:hypothetical protein K1T71_002234 [Dendrolimus kikuchii]
MYRQVLISTEDTDYQRILWRQDSKDKIQHLRLLRLTFGTASAPFLAIRTLHQIAHDEGDRFPIAREITLSDFYMDDLMTGSQNISEGKEIYYQMKQLLAKGGFDLQKWKSNNSELMKHMREGKEEGEENLELKTDIVMKILGLTWSREVDEFVYTVKLPPLKIPVTKRSVISHISMLFDPLGWLAPVIIKAKILIQKLWLCGINWDEELPSILLTEWCTYRSELEQLVQYRIPRWLRTYRGDTLELHGFSDASNQAYAAVVYIRVVNQQDDVYSRLVTAKTKVAPIKQVSIPRLELCGAVLVSKLLCEVAEVLNIDKTKIYARTDSTVVLAWLSKHPSNWKTFVANRVSEILTVMDIGEPLVLVPEFNFEQSNLTSLKRWQLTQRMLQDFWRRWSKEYLTQFMNRYKWAYQNPEPAIGDVVLVIEDDLPPARWLYGIITQKHPGLDGITRVVTLKCKGSQIKRPVSKLCILPVSN